MPKWKYITFFFDNVYKITTGFFLENTIVVAEGEMVLEGVFQVCVIIFISLRPALLYLDFVSSTGSSRFVYACDFV